MRRWASDDTVTDFMHTMTESLAILFRRKTATMSDDVLRVAVLTVPCLFGLWTAVACRRAQYHGLPGADALVWAGLSGAFFLLSLMKTARGLGLLRGFDGADAEWLRSDDHRRETVIGVRACAPLSKEFQVPSRRKPPG